MLLVKLNMPLVTSNLVKSPETSASNFYSYLSNAALSCQ